MIRYQKIECSSFLNIEKNGSSSANPYSGCVHSCVYCYAQYMHKFNQKHDPSVTPNDFGTKIFVKINCAEILEKELKTLKKKNLAKKSCFFSSITDPYQPCERIYRLSRSCLNIFLKHEYPVKVITKSNIILEDINLLIELNNKKLVSVGISLTRASNINTEIKNFLEPNSSSTKNLLEVLKILNNNNIPNFVFLNPVVPFFTDTEPNLTNLLLEISKTGCNKIFADTMNLTSLTWNLFRERLEKFDKNLIPQFYNLYFKYGHKKSNNSYRPSDRYCYSLYSYIKKQAVSLNMDFGCAYGFKTLWTKNWWKDLEYKQRIEKQLTLFN